MTQGIKDLLDSCAREAILGETLKFTLDLPLTNLNLPLGKNLSICEALLYMIVHFEPNNQKQISFRMASLTHLARSAKQN